jgi:hypothetical protein
MEFYADVMPEAQRRVLKAGAPVATANRFYLAGGTAIAIYLGHRESIDLDWFTGESMGDPLDCANHLRAGGFELNVSSVARGTVHGSSNGVKLSFLEYRYPLLRPVVQWPEYGCDLASLEDLACMKLSAISSRGARKDFIDLHALGTERFSLAEMLDLYQQKFDTTDLFHVLSSLTYFDDAEAEAIPKLHRPLDWNEVKRSFKDWVNDYVRDQNSRRG